MTAAALPYNLPAIVAPFDASASNSVAPIAAQMNNGFIPNVDKIMAEQNNWLHNAETAHIQVSQLLGLALPFNPVAGASIVATPAGGIVTLKNSVSGATEFYVALTNRAIGYTDPSLDPTNWAYINFPVLAKLTEPYADSTGTADAIVASYIQPYPALQDGARFAVGLALTNATTSPTFAPTLNGNVQTARTIWKFIGVTAVALAPGDLPGVAYLAYDLPNLRYILINPMSTGGNANQTFSAAPAVSAAQVTRYDQVFGVGQTRQNLTASRALNVTYTNSTGKAIFVKISMYWGAAGGVAQLNINGGSSFYDVVGASTAGGYYGIIDEIILPGETYQLVSATASITVWAEIR